MRPSRRLSLALALSVSLSLPACADLAATMAFNALPSGKSSNKPISPTAELISGIVVMIAGGAFVAISDPGPCTAEEQLTTPADCTIDSREEEEIERVISGLLILGFGAALAHHGLVATGSGDAHRIAALERDIRTHAAAERCALAATALAELRVRKPDKARDLAREPDVHTCLVVQDARARGLIR